MLQQSNALRRTIDPCRYDLRFATTTPISTSEPSEYVTQIQGQILFEKWPNDLAEPIALPMGVGCIALSLYDLLRAEHDGRDPLEVFDCVSESALDLYKLLYRGFEPRSEVQQAVGPQGILFPSLLVIEAVELLPRHRGHDLGLAAALKAMHVFGPAGGLAALLAAPLRIPVREGTDQARWRRRMKMDEFEPDSPDVRAKLGAYWGGLGFKGVGPAPSDIYVRSLETPLPTVAEVMAGLQATGERDRHNTQRS
jgi:hypothetical protein